ncbi:30S ribosomal protein S15 [Mangrovivirga sp. M17]|uniref:Small ribosomal subunit protein uS15 n=1 Tax=Mangrovivirga halotolerans TaxID=2993936 RepID=A0ABT3RSW0_9BACT|nr:30S ribosomal protein S15 [Mangrovivirga halotolerans]MCX2744337.1 30S ribosomal protein S15 [Mangrovivirga halotolerans]
MYLTKEKKQEIFENHGRLKSKDDTGSAESQIALFTYRITHLTNHLKSNKKDHSTRVGLLRLVGKRRRLLNYLQEIDIERYRAILKELKLRK